MTDAATESTALLKAAITHHQAGRAADAEGAYRAYLATSPRDANALAALAALLGATGRTANAVALYREALAVHPDHFQSLVNLGAALRELGEPDEAELVLQRALEINPGFVPARLTLGATLHDLGRAEEALACAQTVIDARPEVAEAHFNIANLLAEQYRLDEAVAAYRRALELKPRMHEARWNLSHVLLLIGQYREGWECFEARWDACPHAPRPNFRQPQWRGEDLAGKTLLIVAEQGYGDTLQFVRYVPLLAERGARVLLAVPPELEAVAGTVSGCAQVVRSGEAPPPFDFYCPMMSLPGATGTTLDSIPAPVPYVSADPEKRARWAKRLGAPGPLRVGLVWSSGIRTYGREVFYAGVTKSVTLAQLAPLTRARGVEFYSLQKGPPADEAKRPPSGMKITDWTADLRDFSDTAALIDALDLVITVDTAAAHLAGALGKPVWNLVRYHGCWRWLRERVDTPWYPTMRLFRQRQAGDWRVPIEAAGAALTELAAVRVARPRGVVRRLFGR